MFGGYDLCKIKKQTYYKNKIYSSLGNKIKVAGKDNGKQKTYIMVDGLGIMNYFELYNRLFRHGIHNFYKINDEIDCIVIKKKILFYKGRKIFRGLDIENGSRPLRNGIVFEDDHIIYSEYHGNKNREPVNMYKYNFIEDKKEILYTFDDIRHIHCIHQNINDPNYLYIGTGDLDKECGIYKFNLEGLDIRKIGGGSQIWRAVSILQSNNVLYWGTDDPDNRNYIMRYNQENNKLEKTQKIDGPAYYSVMTKNNDMFIATTVEDRKEHKAVIYKTSDGKRWDKHIEFKKDIFHTKYFGYGVVEFINNQEELGELVYSLNGLKYIKE